MLGGRSEIGLAVAQRLVSAGRRPVVLAARRSHDLDAEKSALRAAGASSVACVEFDADDVTNHRRILDQVVAEHGPLETVVSGSCWYGPVS